MTQPPPAVEPVSQPVAFLSPEEIIARGASDIPYLRLAPYDVFARRALRLRELAAGHPMVEYLRFVAQLAEAQHEALANLPFIALPEEAKLAEARDLGISPLHVAVLLRHPGWCQVLRGMMRFMLDHAQGLSPQATATLKRVEGSRDELYEGQLSKLVNGVTVGLDLATAPLIGAAAQVYWKHLAANLGAGAFPRIEAENVCPVCASRPVASVVQIGGMEGGHRYLHCSLCESEWHLVRIKCANCASTREIQYHQVEDPQGVAGGINFAAIRAETCGDCSTYLKIFYRDRDPHLDAAADDLASLTLDLLVAEAGYLRSGQNLLLIHGEAD